MRWYYFAMGRKLGTSGKVIRRKDLRPKKEQSDAQLLASAARAAESWQKRLEKTRRADTI
jgi:hypothetical protein